MALNPRPRPDQNAQQSQMSDRPAQMLAEGLSGPEVEQWQQFLQANGYDVGNVDGIFGPRTKRATQQFQRDHGINADGIAGTETFSVAGFPEPMPQPRDSVDEVMDVDGTAQDETGAGLGMVAGGAIGYAIYRQLVQNGWDERSARAATQEAETIIGGGDARATPQVVTEFILANPQRYGANVPAIRPTGNDLTTLGNFTAYDTTTPSRLGTDYAAAAELFPQAQLGQQFQPAIAGRATQGALDQAAQPQLMLPPPQSVPQAQAPVNPDAVTAEELMRMSGAGTAEFVDPMTAPVRSRGRFLPSGNRIPLDPVTFQPRATGIR